VSYTDRPWLTGWQKLGCLAYFLVASAVVAEFAIMGLAPSSDEPEPPLWLSLLYFPGAAIIAVLLGGLLLHIFTRDRE